MKTALVTGAAQGVGGATALEFARLGYQTVIVDFNEPDLLDLKREIEAMGQRVSAYVCDVADEQRVREVCAAAVEEFGSVEILVNNAGLYRGFFGDFLDGKRPFRWHHYFELHYFKQFVKRILGIGG